MTTIQQDSKNFQNTLNSLSSLNCQNSLDTNVSIDPLIISEHQLTIPEPCSHEFTPTNTLLNDPYATLSHFFLELRGRGLSLSALDGETLFRWKNAQVPVEVIMDIAWKIADDCMTQKRAFPASLAPIDRQVQKFLKKRIEF